MKEKGFRVRLWAEACHKVTILIKPLQILGVFKYSQFECITEPEYNLILFSLLCPEPDCEWKTAMATRSILIFTVISTMKLWGFYFYWFGPGVKGLDPWNARHRGQPNWGCLDCQPIPSPTYSCTEQVAEYGWRKHSFEKMILNFSPEFRWSKLITNPCFSSLTSRGWHQFKSTWGVGVRFGKAHKGHCLLWV